MNCTDKSGPVELSDVLDRSGSRPLYRQIEQILREELRRAGGDGRRLTENDLIARFGVSRFTVRQALAALAAEGLIDRHQRRGTYSRSSEPIEQPLGGLYSFAGSMRARGLPSTSRVMATRRIRASGALQEQLALAEAAPVVRIERLRLVEGEPLLLENIWLPAADVPGIERLDLSGSVYEVLRECYGRRVTSARESIRPVVLVEDQATMLGVAAGAPAFFVERVSMEGQRPVEVRQSLIRGDRYLYSVDLRNGGEQEAGR